MNRQKALWLTFVIVVTLSQAMYFYAFFVEPRLVVIEKVVIPNEPLARALDGLTIVQLSDLHITHIGYVEMALIDKVNALKPDIIIISGDLIGDREGVTALWNVLKLLQARHQIYAIYGDEDGPILDLRESPAWDKAGVTLIDGKALRLNLKGKPDSEFWLIGGEGAKTLPAVIERTNDTLPRIFIAPDPDIIKQAALQKIDLVLTGGTHGGQVGIPFLWRFFTYAKRSPYMRGLYKVKNTFLYVNRGISSQRSVRFLCPPEITLFSFTDKKITDYTVLAQDR